MEPWARKESRHLLQPVRQKLLHAGFCWIDFRSMRKRSKICVTLQAEQVVQVAVEFQARNHINVPLSSICNDVPYFVLAIPPVRVDKWVALEFDRQFGIE